MTKNGYPGNKYFSDLNPCYTQAFHTYRINLSPFTKDFRVWGATIETKSIYLRATFKLVSLIIKLQLYTNPYILRIISKMFPSKVVS